MAVQYGLDTNVLVRLTGFSNPQYGIVSRAIRILTERGVQLCCAPQNIGELWNVGTRPIDRNGLGLSPLKMSEEVRLIEQRFMLLPENAHVYEAWMRLLRMHDVRGVQVHDAHLAAMLEVHGVRRLLTFNGRDFARFPSLTPVHPAEIQAAEK